MTTFKNILERLENLHPKKIDLSLLRLRKLLLKLGNPHLDLPPVIHIAGTNGKGSVTSFLRSIFESSGYSVNVYTSPHLIKFNERIRIKSKLISNRLLGELLQECEIVNSGESITFFEITTAAAFLAFSREKSDILIIETGLGGRFDATNVIRKPILSVLTPISIDHTNLLGNSLSKIAIEKLGIIKRNSNAVISQQNRHIRKLIRDYTKKKNVKIYEEGFEWKIIEKDYEKKHFLLSFKKKKIYFPFPNLYGDHQIENAAVAASSALAQKAFVISEQSISNGIKKTIWPARMQNLEGGKLSQYIGNNFDIWLDGGHNLHACEAMLRVLNKWKGEKIYLILGMIDGKDPINFISKLSSSVSSVTILPIKDHLHINLQQIKNILINKPNFNLKLSSSGNIHDALLKIKKGSLGGKILICGSLYLAGEILKADGYNVN